MSVASDSTGAGTSNIATQWQRFSLIPVSVAQIGEATKPESPLCDWALCGKAVCFTPIEDWLAHCQTQSLTWCWTQLSNLQCSVGPWWGRRGTGVWFSWLRQVFVISRSLTDFCIMISYASANAVKSCEKWNFPSKLDFFSSSHNGNGDLAPALTFHRSPSSYTMTTSISLPNFHTGDNSVLCVTWGFDRQAQLWQSGARAPRPLSPRQTRAQAQNNSLFVDLLETINCIQMTVSCRYKPDVGIPLLSSISVQSGSSKPGSRAVAGKGGGWFWSFRFMKPSLMKQETHVSVFAMYSRAVWLRSCAKIAALLFGAWVKAKTVCWLNALQHPCRVSWGQLRCTLVYVFFLFFRPTTLPPSKLV